jgi:quinone-modifying oxidoreductase, subunit QmoA
MTDSNAGPAGTVLVVGGGIAGLTAAVEAAETGSEVYLVEKGPSLGGRVARMHRYFPKLCPPSCGLEILLKRVRTSPRLHVLTLAEVISIGGQPGDLEVKLAIAPRYVNERCTACGDCIPVCPGERRDEFNYGVGTTRAVYLPQPLGFPVRFAIDRAACPPGCELCVSMCKPNAIELGAQPQSLTLRVGAVVLATGWQPYDARKLPELGFGQHADVVTNVMFERLAAADGPTQGRILRPSDGKPPAHVTFVQCAGSRDEKHLPYCSAVCCMASLKQATYVREQLPEASVHVLYIDVRTLGRLEQFYARVAADPKVTLSRGKAGKVSAGASGKLVVEAEDTAQGAPLEIATDLVVLATGMVPSGLGALGAAVGKDAFGFLTPDGNGSGVVAAGCARRPGDVTSTTQDATGAALHALQASLGGRNHG